MVVCDSYTPNSSYSSIVVLHTSRASWRTPGVWIFLSSGFEVFGSSVFVPVQDIVDLA
jgi:hypothetical protein